MLQRLYWPSMDEYFMSEITPYFSQRGFLIRDFLNNSQD